MKINMLSEYLTNKYGKKIYKLSLSSGLSCPNRDGKIGVGGCIFCSGSGAGEFAQCSKESIHTQIDTAKKMLSQKLQNEDGYIAYFQPFSNTYGSIEYLRKLYTEVINRDDIKILSIATRPDCLDEEKIKFFAELNKIKPVWIELGLQTIHEHTAKYIRRGYPLEIYKNIAKQLKDNGINVITHLILGLPNESKNDMVESAKLAGKYSDGLKFHMLYIQQNTDICKDYNQGMFKSLEKDEYIDILCECLRFIPEDVVIHRITGDCEKESLISPLWSADKLKVLRDIKNAFYDRDIVQGEKLK